MRGRDAAIDEDQHRPGHEVATPALALLATLAIAPPPASVGDALLARAAAYVARFELAFEHIVSDEHYEQRLSGSAYRGTQRRRTTGEMLFWWVPDASAWLTVRNVLTVDGRPIDQRDDLFHRAFSQPGDPLAHLRRMRDESARYNIGTIFRNINYPTLALQFLEPVKAKRFSFTPAGADRIDGIAATRVAYHERDAPTTVQDDKGNNLFSTGTLWIADDGTVLRTQVRIVASTAPLSMEATVEFRTDPKLGMRVPVRMTETYQQRERGRTTERIDGTAAYSNFRRFETSGRIIQ